MLRETPPLPLTAVQRRFWFLDRIGQGRSVPNVILPLRLKGPIDFDAMMAAVNTLLARHEALRMRIGDRDGEPYPEISAGREDLMTVADLTALPDADREREGDRLSNELTGETFNLVTGPLAKVLFVRLSPTDNLMTLSMHHIVADGWSSSILLRELGAVYSAVLRGDAPDLPPLAYQYVDYAAWEAAQVRDGLFERQLGYWREKLAGVPPLLDLPTDRPSAHATLIPRQSRRLRHRGWYTWTRLQQFGKRHDATLFMTVLAAFAVVLHRLTAQDEIVIGTPVANQRQSGAGANRRAVRQQSFPAAEHRGKSEFRELSVAGPPRDDRSDRQPRSSLRHGCRGDKSGPHARPRADLPSNVRAA